MLIRRRHRRVVTTHTCLPLFRRPNLIAPSLGWATNSLIVHFRHKFCERNIVLKLSLSIVLSKYLSP
jgi:hypothetical protein